MVQIQLIYQLNLDHQSNLSENTHVRFLPPTWHIEPPSSPRPGSPSGTAAGCRTCTSWQGPRTRKGWCPCRPCRESGIPLTPKIVSNFPGFFFPLSKYAPISGNPPKAMPGRRGANFVSCSPAFNAEGQSSNPPRKPDIKDHPRFPGRSPVHPRREHRNRKR